MARKRGLQVDQAFQTDILKSQAGKPDLRECGCRRFIALTGSGRSELVHELTRLHNLGLSGGFLAISSGLALVVLPLPESRSRIMLPVRRVRFRRAPVG
jgi:hypothetical protein